MLGVFKKRKIDVSSVLECSVSYIGDYLKEKEKYKLDDAFCLLFKIVSECEEHVQLQLKPLIRKYELLSVSNIGVYEGFLYSVVHTLNYCLLYIRVNNLY